ncbi:MAG: hypothetical protein ACRBB0_26965 [Pelagimonas sp.]|uniref:hypothetical protein n=1 Tax=Pelagimonas sp. TaxID=2073170 RepID=UPI003D6B945B
MPSIVRQVSLGNLITILTVVVAAAFGWATLQANVEALTKQVEALKAMEPRIYALEREQAVTAASLAGIHKGIADLQEDLDENNRLLRTLLQRPKTAN